MLSTKFDSWSKRFLKELILVADLVLLENEFYIILNVTFFVLMLLYF